MVVIDTKTDKVFENLSKTMAARIVGVSRGTIHRWMKRSKREQYGKFVIYFDCQRMKQRTGVPKDPPKKQSGPINPSFRRP